MAGETDLAPSAWVAAALVVAPIVAGILLFVLFEGGPVHRLGLFMIGAGVIVGAALVLSRGR